MSENMENDEAVETDKNDQALKDMIGRMQQQLTYLEKKVDVLIAKLDEKPRIAVQSPFRPPQPSAAPYKERSSYPPRSFNREGANEAPRPFGPGSAKGRGFKKPFGGGKRPGFGGKPFHSKRSGGFHK